MTGSLSLWVIYDSPLDYPGQFVVKRWEVEDGSVTVTDDVTIAATLQAAREAVPPGKVLLSRSEEDATVISETWV